MADTFFPHHHEHDHHHHCDCGSNVEMVDAATRAILAAKSCEHARFDLGKHIVEFNEYIRRAYGSKPVSVVANIGTFEVTGIFDGYELLNGDLYPRYEYNYNKHFYIKDGMDQRDPIYDQSHTQIGTLKNYIYSSLASHADVESILDKSRAIINEIIAAHTDGGIYIKIKMSGLPSVEAYPHGTILKNDVLYYVFSDVEGNLYYASEVVVGHSIGRLPGVNDGTINEVKKSLLAKETTVANVLSKLLEVQNFMATAEAKFDGKLTHDTMLNTLVYSILNCIVKGGDISVSIYHRGNSDETAIIAGYAVVNNQYMCVLIREDNVLYADVHPDTQKVYSGSRVYTLGDVFADYGTVQRVDTFSGSPDADSIISAINTAKNDIIATTNGGYEESLASILNGRINNVETQITDVGDLVINSIGQNIDALKTATGQMFNTQKTVISDKIDTKAEEVENNVREIVSEQIEELITPKWGEITDLATEFEIVKQELSSEAGAITSNIDQAVEDTASNITSDGNNTRSAISAINTRIDTLESKIDELLRRIPA